MTHGSSEPGARCMPSQFFKAVALYVARGDLDVAHNAQCPPTEGGRLPGTNSEEALKTLLWRTDLRLVR